MFLLLSLKEKLICVSQYSKTVLFFPFSSCNSAHAVTARENVHSGRYPDDVLPQLVFGRNQRWPHGRDLRLHQKYRGMFQILTHVHTHVTTTVFNGVSEQPSPQFDETPLSSTNRSSVLLNFRKCWVFCCLKQPEMPTERENDSKIVDTYSCHAKYWLAQNLLGNQPQQSVAVWNIAARLLTS